LNDVAILALKLSVLTRIRGNSPEASQLVGWKPARVPRCQRSAVPKLTNPGLISSGAMPGECVSTAARPTATSVRHRAAARAATSSLCVGSPRLLAGSQPAGLIAHSMLQAKCARPTSLSQLYVL